jgi:hypothetical protein
MDFDQCLDWSTVQKVRDKAKVVVSPENVRQLEADLDVNQLLNVEFWASTGPWQDGAQIDIEVAAVAVRTCGITLESFEETIAGSLSLKYVPEGSLHLPAFDGEIVIDLNEDDPPELFPPEGLQMRDLLRETLALELSAFPRKPGVQFEAPEPIGSLSPFAALAKLDLTGKSQKT